MSLKTEAKRTASVLALLFGAVSVPNCYAQSAGAGEAMEPMETITVTGYRASLAASAVAKRTNVGFTDSVVAEDIGKFPDRNLAEAVNRIPGVQLSRSAEGEGTNITIRGLGPNFSQVLLNGNLAVVAGTVDRSTPLDLFPIELFSKITVSKSIDAHTLEGGIGGSVNIVNVRPLDNPEDGFHLSYSLQSQYAESGGSFSPRGAVIASQNWGNKLGVLIGIAGQSYRYRADGYEDVGIDIVGIQDQQRNNWPDVTNPATKETKLDPRVCPQSVCSLNWSASTPFHWAQVVPAGISDADRAKYGLGAAGTPYAYAGPAYGTTDFTTPGGTSGLSMQQLSNAIWPHLPRTEYRFGHNDRMSFLTAVEYRPTEALHFMFDGMFEHQVKHQQLEDMQQFNRQSCNTAGTTGPSVFGVAGNNCQVPVNVKLDSQNNVISATILNSSYFLDNTDMTDKLNFVYLNPSVEWNVNKWLKVNGSAYFDDSYMDHHQISLMFQTTPASGISTTYTMSPGAKIPTITTNAPFNDAKGGWQWYITRAQPSEYTAISKGTHWDATFGDEKANVRVGYAYDQQYRKADYYGASTNMGNCIALGTASGGSCTLPDGSAMAAGTAGLVPNAEIYKYLKSGPADFMSMSGQNAGSLGSYLIADLPALMRATKISDYEANRTLTTRTSGGGSFDEKVHGGYVEANATTPFLGHDVRLSAGVRYVATHQKLTAPLITKFGNYTAQTERDYDAVLPSLNVSTEIIDNLMVRFAGARAMTRANPGNMFPGSSFPTATLSPMTSGNPDLQPYYSDNFDLGFEYYTGGPGVIALNFFAKDVSGFTQSSSRQVRFGDTGMPFSALTPTQQAEFNANGGNNILVTVNSQVNLQQKMHIRGLEFQVVQPLDMLVEGLGISANYTRVQQGVDGGLTQAVASSLATGIAPWTGNLGAYYEGYGFSMHVTYNYTAAYVVTASPAYQGIPQAEYNDIHRQVDLSASYKIPGLEGTIMDGTEVTFDAVNLNNEQPFYRYIGNKNQPSYAYWPGPQYTLGIRGKF